MYKICIREFKIFDGGNLFVYSEKPFLIYESRDDGVNVTWFEIGLNLEVDFESVEPVASAITPVPGGVGPMTIAMLMNNCVESVRSQEGSQ